MKRFFLFSSSAAVLFTTLCLVPPCHAARDAKYQDAVTMPDGVSVMDSSEEARKIRRLAKLALANNSSSASRQILSDEIAMVEKNKKLKENIVQNLLQDDDPDPTLPKVVLVKYKDGAIRGLLFIQTDSVHGNNPNRLAWPLDEKRERKEQTRH